MIYDETGLSLRVFSGKIQALYVFRPGTAKQIWDFLAGSAMGPARHVVAHSGTF